MNIEDLPDDSDSSDEDYIPESKPEEVLSEVESDGDLDGELSNDDNEDDDAKMRGRKRRRKPTKKRKKHKPLKEATVTEAREDNTGAEQGVPEEEKKQEIDDIWADFMKDTGFRGKSSKAEEVEKKPDQSASNAEKTINVGKDVTQRRKESIKISRVFEFAGEEVTVEKEVPADSAEARLFRKEPNVETEKKVKSKKAGLSGISSVLSQLGKKPKISTLEKTKLDWDRYKKEENLDEELKTYNKGKDGYLERQDFLERADLRRFEIEREVRSIERNRRMNNL